MIFAFGEKQEKKKEEKVLSSENCCDEMKIAIHSLFFFLSTDHKVVITNFVNKLNRVDLFAINSSKSICVINLLF